MKLLVSGATNDVRAWLKVRSDIIGVLVTPGASNKLAGTGGVQWAADNNCFQGLNESEFTGFVDCLTRQGTRPMWVACPDKVGDSDTTLSMFDEWEPFIRSRGLPVAFVLQDGITEDSVPWNRCDAVFVGGSTEFKMGDSVPPIIRLAQSMGKMVHVGRVNTKSRFSHFHDLKVDTVDGSGFSKWPKRIAMAVRWMDELKWLEEIRNRPLRCS